MEEEILEEGRLYATFERHGEFADAQARLLALDLTETTTAEQERDEAALFRRLSDILDEYQEQAHLLDPFLEQLVEPVVAKIRHYAQSLNTNNADDPTNLARIERVALLLYSYVKSLRFFPHEIADLALARVCMNGAAREPDQWALRYAVLLWLALICMIPFDLAQFDEGADGETADALEALARPFLSRAGLEREASALLLARLYMRKDTRVRFGPFLGWVDECACRALFRHCGRGRAHDVLNGNTVVRKFKTKLMARIPLRILPPTSNATRRKGRALTGDDPSVPEPVPEDEIDVPEEVEVVLEQLFKSLQDKVVLSPLSLFSSNARHQDTIVLETLMGLFAIHSIAAASLYDLPAIAESTWHGACLACAEMARRGLVAHAALPALIEWLSKALYFDLRKGAHSIGSSVRDAAAYVLWALARAQDPAALAPHADNLARRLVTVALYDREIHIRRAASAAFQEHVGRTSLFAHGIDVLRKTDFYAVSVRRNAFLVAAPQVAEHVEYRGFLFDHLLNVTARHWDVSMRRLGAQSLRLICGADLLALGPVVITRAAKLLESADTADLHGALLALAEISAAYRELAVPPEEREKRLREAFGCLALIPERVLLGPRNELVTAAACSLLARTITRAEIDLKTQSAVPSWRKLLDFGLKHRNAPVQEAAADAMGAVSRLVDYMSAETFNALLNALLHGLEDYTIDERGDVGSWIRIACLRGLTAFCEILMPNARTLPAFAEYFPSAKYHGIIGGVLKQGVERLDNVRQDAGECFQTLLGLAPPDVRNGHEWTCHGLPLLRELESELMGWKDGVRLFPKAVRLLDIPHYRKSVLAGLVLSLGSKTESTHRPVGLSLVEYSKSLPLAGDTDPEIGYNLVELAGDLLSHARANFTSNGVVVPVLQTFNVLLEADALRRLQEDSHGETSLQDLLSIVTRNVARLKSIQRILESMKIVVNTLAFPTLFERCVTSLPDFLAHEFPSIRSGASEYLYLVLQGTDIGRETDEVEEVLLETEWSSLDIEVAREASVRLRALFLQ
ncbi:tubulin folding cofactor D C terminal-domain-containing protein [Mycena leptocephala]|nr:tubulin folding cofactor D C terminal-domain-containing protein [Mycena leptocephala]